MNSDCLFRFFSLKLSILPFYVLFEPRNLLNHFSIIYLITLLPFLGLTETKECAIIYLYNFPNESTILSAFDIIYFNADMVCLYTENARILQNFTLASKKYYER